MIKKTTYIFLFLVFASVGCSEYQRVLKSSDVDFKYNQAVKYFEAEKYTMAMPLLEELVPLLRGTDKAEKTYYLYAYCNYYENLLYSASYHFKKFSKTFPSSKHAEETLFMNAYCKYLLSPQAALDANDTYAAINELQLFINTFPDHELVDSSNVLMDKLHDKLEKKSYLNAKQYYDIYDYKAAIVALNNTLIDFPSTPFKEEILFLILKSNFYLAQNSIEEKKLERIDNTIEAYYTFVDSFEKSDYIKDAESIYNKSVDRKKQLN